MNQSGAEVVVVMEEVVMGGIFSINGEDRGMRAPGAGASGASPERRPTGRPPAASSYETRVWSKIEMRH